tara:strand:- start:1518 stop:1754 length:237 start_codon:yes stop_codon:yes gene_type:complete
MNNIQFDQLLTVSHPILQIAALLLVFIVGLACIQALKCNKICPSGINTHNPDLQMGLLPPTVTRLDYIHSTDTGTPSQ